MVGYIDSQTGKHRILSVHRAVLMAFVGLPTPDRPHVNHKDCDPSNNKLENLEWCSPGREQRTQSSSWPTQALERRRKLRHI